MFAERTSNTSDFRLAAFWAWQIAGCRTAIGDASWYSNSRPSVRCRQRRLGLHRLHLNIGTDMGQRNCCPWKACRYSCEVEVEFARLRFCCVLHAVAYRVVFLLFSISYAPPPRSRCACHRIGPRHWPGYCSSFRQRRRFHFSYGADGVGAFGYR